MPVNFNSNHAAKAPIMYWAPCAKLMTLSMPKMTAKTEAQHGVEGPVDQPQQKLAEQDLGGTPSSSIMSYDPSIQPDARRPSVAAA